MGSTKKHITAIRGVIADAVADLMSRMSSDKDDSDKDSYPPSMK